MMYNIKYHNHILENNNSTLLLNSVKSIVNEIESGNSYYQIFKKYDFRNSSSILYDIANTIKNSFSDVIVISMGGATLNPQMLVNFLGQDQHSPKIHFLNNTDPLFFADLIANINLKHSCFIAISNSGETLETNGLVGCVLEEYHKNNVKNVSDRSFFITNPTTGTLREIATELGGTLLPHQEGISGRYSGLSSVSLFIGLIAGISIDDYLLGANEVIDDFCSNLDKSKAALGASALYYSNKNILINIAYLQKLLVFLEWYSQIIAESLGKNGKGFTPLKGLGPNDQHSMLQLYLEGPQDKYFSFLYVENTKQDFIHYKASNLNTLGYLANQNLSDLNKANYDATINALMLKNVPIRDIKLKSLSAKSFGAITCHLMFEVITIAHLMKVNPFNQPGVELIKNQSKKLLHYSTLKD